jgi:hypothetical protein
MHVTFMDRQLFLCFKDFLAQVTLHCLSYKLKTRFKLDYNEIVL